jgi:hypothetical protein
VSDYIPFDIGRWKARLGCEFECPRHGKQFGGPAIEVSPRPGEVIQRNYCGPCLLEVLKDCTAWT